MTIMAARDDGIWKHVLMICLPLLGLTSAMYMKGAEAVPNPDPQAGLYIRQRQGAEVVQAPIPADQIAYQMGEAMQVSTLPMLSRGCYWPAFRLQCFGITLCWAQGCAGCHSCGVYGAWMNAQQIAS